MDKLWISCGSNIPSNSYAVDGDIPPIVNAIATAIVTARIGPKADLGLTTHSLVVRICPPHGVRGQIHNEESEMQNRPLFKLHRSAEDFVEVLAWLDSNKLESHLMIHLGELPSHHLWWDAVIEKLGEARLVELGVDI